MSKPTLRSWFASLFGDTAASKPETRARLDFQPLDVRTLPTVMGGMSVICGSVYVDTNCNGVRDAGEAGIAGAKVTLTGKTSAGQTVCKDVLTDCNGNFEFTQLGKGCYTLTETQPAGFKDGADCGPTSATANDQFGAINLNGSSKQGPYIFGEQKQESKGSAKKGSAKKGSAKKGSGGKGSSGKCDIWAGYDPKQENECDKYKPCGYGYEVRDDSKGSGGKGSSKKGSGGKGSSKKGSSGKGNDCGITAVDPKAYAATTLANLYGVVGKKK